MEKPKINQILEVLSDGGKIDYAPLSGGIILLNNTGKRSSINIDITTFLQLQDQDRIEHTGEMRQGHNIFHGRVNFYKLKT